MFPCKTSIIYLTYFIQEIRRLSEGIELFNLKKIAEQQMEEALQTLQLDTHFHTILKCHFQ